MTDFNLLQEGLECNRVMDKIWWYKSSIEVFCITVKRTDNRMNQNSHQVNQKQKWGNCFWQERKY